MYYKYFSSRRIDKVRNKKKEKHRNLQISIYHQYNVKIKSVHKKRVDGETVDAAHSKCAEFSFMRVRIPFYLFK